MTNPRDPVKEAVDELLRDVGWKWEPGSKFRTKLAALLTTREAPLRAEIERLKAERDSFHRVGIAAAQNFESEMQARARADARNRALAGALRLAHERLERLDGHHPDRICGLDHAVGANASGCTLCGALAAGAEEVKP